MEDEGMGGEEGCHKDKHHLGATREIENKYWHFENNKNFNVFRCHKLVLFF